MQVIWLTSVRGVISTTSMPTTRPFAARAVDQPPGLRERNPARHRRGHARRDGAVHAVHVDGEIVAAAVRDAPQDGIHARLMQLVGGDQVSAVGPGRVHLLLARAAGGAEADLEDLAHVLHLGGPAHWAREAIAHAVDLVAPVEMLVDLHECDRPAALERPQHWDRHGVVAAEHDRHRGGNERWSG